MVGKVSAGGWSMGVSCPEAGWDSEPAGECSSHAWLLPATAGFVGCRSL